MMDVVYGVELKDANHPFVAIAEETLRAAHVAAVPGAFLVDIFPWCE
jgi:hypothetical protein